MGNPLANNLSEAEFLGRLSADARAEMTRLLAAMRGSLAELADVRAWAQAHPKASVAAAFGLAFATSALATATLARASAKASSPSPGKSNTSSPPRRASTAGRLLAGLRGPLGQLAVYLLKSAAAAWFNRHAAFGQGPEAAPAEK